MQDASGTTTCTYPALTTSQAESMVVRLLARFRDAADTFTPTATWNERGDLGSTVRTGGQFHSQDKAPGVAGVQAAVTVAPSNTTASRYLAVTLALKPKPPPTNTAVARVSLGAGNDPVARTGHMVKVRARVTATNPLAALYVNLYEGATLRFSGSAQPLTTTLAEYSLALTDPEAAAITSYADLEVRFSGYSDSGPATFEVDQVWLETPESAGLKAAASLAMPFTVGAPKLAVLTDNFNVSLDKTVKWAASTAGATFDGTYQARLTCSISPGDTLATPLTYPYDLTNSAIYARVSPANNAATRETTFSLVDVANATNYIRFRWAGGLLYAERYNAGVLSGSASITPDFQTHVYVRFRESAGTIYAEAGPDPYTFPTLITSWTVASTPWLITKVQVRFNSLYTGADAGYYALIDNVNAVVPKLATLTDSFETAVDKTVAKWNNCTAGVVWDSGQAKIPCVSGGVGNSLGTTAPNYFDLKDSAIFARVTPATKRSIYDFQAITSNGTRRTSLRLSPRGDPGDYFALEWYPNYGLYGWRVTNSAQDGALGAVAGSIYNPVTHAWVRIREASGTVYFEVSPDGLNWTTFHSMTVTSAFSIREMSAEFRSWYSGTETPANAYVDNVNLLSPVGASLVMRYALAGPKIGTLKDDFASALDKATKWPASSVGAVWDVSGQAKLPGGIQSEPGNNIRTGAVYSLRGSSIQAKVTPSTLADRYTWLHLFEPGTPSGDGYGGARIKITVAGAATPTIAAYGYLDSTNLGASAAITYSPTTHAYWRIRESAGTVYVETGPDGINFPTLLKSWPTSSFGTGPSIDLLIVDFVCVDYATVAAGDTFVDNVNITPPVGASLALPYKVLSRSGQSLAVPYTVRKATTRTLAVPYGVAGITGRSTTFPYTVRRPIGQPVALPYKVRSLVPRSLALAYLVRGRIARSLALNYGVAGTTGMSLAVVYAIRVPLGRSVALAYGIAGTVGRSLVFGWTLPQWFPPTSTPVPGGWVSTLGGQLHEAVDERVPDAADYIEYTAAWPAPAETAVLALSAAQPDTPGDRVLRYMASRDPDGGKAGLTVRLRQGTTVIAEWHHDSLPSTPEVFTRTLSPAEEAAITDYAALNTELVADIVRPRRFGEGGFGEGTFG